MKKRVAIIGGGIGGLTVGYELLKEGYNVTVFEKEKENGGLLGDFQIEGEKLEKFYHHIFKTDKDVIGLIEELGLKKKLKWHKSSIGLYYNGKFYPFLGAIDLLMFKELGLIDKFRLGLIYLWLKFDKKWQKYEKVSANEWMEKWAGKRAYNVIWKPLLKGKFHQFYKDVSMAWLWARIHTRGGSTNEKGEEVLGYMDGGFGQIIEELAKSLKIKTLCLENISFDKEISKFDIVIDTRPIEGVNYLGAVNLVFSSNQSLSEYYWHNINDLKSPFLVMVQHNNLLKNGGYNGKNVYYLGAYVPQDHRYFKVSDEKIAREFFDYLKKIIPKFDEKQIREKKIIKMKYAQHIVGLNYMVPKHRAEENYYRLNFAQIYPEDRGINFAVKEAKKMVKLIKYNDRNRHLK